MQYSENSLFNFSNKKIKSNIKFDIALLALSLIKGLGFKSAYKLADFYGEDIGVIFEMDFQDLTTSMYTLNIHGAASFSKLIAEQKSELIEMATEMGANLAQKHINIISYDDLPKRMQSISDGPKWLFVQGDKTLIYKELIVGVVGTRLPSQYGLQRTIDVARCLQAYDIAIVSGLAEGIDDAIHQASMTRKIPNIAFLGHGINIVFPTSTASTREKILESGGVIATEYFPNENFQKSYFVKRNRLQALLSKLLIIIEAKEVSGTAHTLRFAHEYKKAIVGIKNDILGIDSLIEAMQYPICDISSTSGMRKLDLIIQNKLNVSGNDMKTVERIMKILANELSIRHLSKSQYKNLQSRLIAMSIDSMSEIEND